MSSKSSEDKTPEKKSKKYLPDDFFPIVRSILISLGIIVVGIAFVYFSMTYLMLSLEQLNW